MARKTKRGGSAKKASPPPKKSKKSKAPSAQRPAAKSSAKPRPKTGVAPKAARGFYLAAADFDPVLSSKEPRPTGRMLKFESFEAAKNEVVDHLIDLIDRCEQRLWQLKQAGSFEEYQKLAADQRGNG